MIVRWRALVLWGMSVPLGLHLCFIGGASAAADERLLNGAEITAVLTGNTAAGMTGGTAFRQYFYFDGRTIWLMEGAEPDTGRWRVSEDGEYCSIWRFGDWACYRITGEGDAITWVREGNRPFPARILEGRRLEFD